MVMLFLNLYKKFHKSNMQDFVFKNKFLINIHLGYFFYKKNHVNFLYSFIKLIIFFNSLILLHQNYHNIISFIEISFSYDAKF